MAQSLDNQADPGIPVTPDTITPSEPSGAGEQDAVRPLATREPEPLASPRAIAPASAAPTRTPLLPAERALRAVLRVWVVVFVLAALVFLFLSPSVTGFLNALAGFFHWRGPPLNPAVNSLWLVLSVSLLVTLAVISWQAQANVRRNRALITPLLVAKASSALIYLGLFVAVTPIFGYLVGGLVDGSIFLITLVLFLVARGAERAALGE